MRGPGLPQEAKNYCLANPDMEPDKGVLNLAAKGITVTAAQVETFWNQTKQGEGNEPPERRGPVALPKEAKKWALDHPHSSTADVAKAMAEQGIDVTPQQVYNFRYRLETLERARAKKAGADTEPKKARKVEKAPKVRKARRKRGTAVPAPEAVTAGKGGACDAAILSAVEALGSVEEELVSKIQAIRDMRARLRGMAA